MKGWEGIPGYHKLASETREVATGRSVRNHLRRSQSVKFLARLA
ncbi:hypothetical protein [Laspinema palackyanum]